MKSTMSLSAGLGLGLIAYCMILLISREAAVSTLLVMGITSLALIFISLWLLWIVVLPSRPTVTNHDEIGSQKHPREYEPDTAAFNENGPRNGL